MSENKNVNNEEMDNVSISSDNSQELFNLIQSIQSKINMTNTEEHSGNNENVYKANNNNTNCNNNNDDNYTDTNTIKKENNNNLDELLENVVNTTKNINNNNNNANNSSSIDFSSIASLLQNIDLSSVISMFSKKSSSNNNINTNEDFDNSTNLNSDSIFSGIDPGTILKFQRVLSSMNKSDPKKNLLLSLKPFLRKSRQDKLNEYVTMLTIANAIGIFGSKGSDE